MFEYGIGTHGLQFSEVENSRTYQSSASHNRFLRPGRSSAVGRRETRHARRVLVSRVSHTVLQSLSCAVGVMFVLQILACH